MTQSTKNIVLVHGGFVDGSGWESVYSLLKKDDYNVAIVQNPTLSLTSRTGSCCGNRSELSCGTV